MYQKHLQRSLILAESQAPNSYHCATPNCAGWCLYEDEVNTFYCATCQHWNCLTCRAIHEKMDCIQYQRKMKAKFRKDYNARIAQSSLEVIVLCWFCWICDCVLTFLFANLLNPFLKTPLLCYSRCEIRLHFLTKPLWSLILKLLRTCHSHNFIF